MNLNPIILSIPIFFILIALEIFYSWYKKVKYYRFGDAFANIGCGIFEQVTGVFVKIFTIGLYSLVYQNFRIFDIPVNGWTIFLLFLGVDFLYYWAHRMSHQINLFWVGHVVHHQSEDYNLSVALRQGALQKIFTSPFVLPLALLGFNDMWFLYISAFNTLYQFWIHTEAIGKLGPLEWIFNTPSHHRVHHGRDPKYIDKNHAGSLIIWDRMFGTFQAEEEKPHYGITKPVRTFNPLQAHWAPIRDLYDETKKVRGWQKIVLLFKSPGWLPESSGGRQFAPEINSSTYKKFDFSVQKSIHIYLFFQFVLLLGFAAFFLFGYSNFVFEAQIFGAALILLGLSSIGGLFEQKTWANYIEYSRLVLFATYAIYFTNHFMQILVVSLAAVSVFLFIVIKNKSN